MKFLTLLRHAKSVPHMPLSGDFDRPLNKRGRMAAATVGKEMRARQMTFDKVIASPALRVVETLGDVESSYGVLAAQYDPRVYLATFETLLQMIHEVEDEVERLLIVGHNPGLEALALFLTEDGTNQLRESKQYPTGTFAEIKLPIEKWRDLERGMGTIISFIRPRDLDPRLGPDGESD